MFYILETRWCPFASVPGSKGCSFRFHPPVGQLRADDNSLWDVTHTRTSLGGGHCQGSGVQQVARQQVNDEWPQLTRAPNTTVSFATQRVPADTQSTQLNIRYKDELVASSLPCTRPQTSTTRGPTRRLAVPTVPRSSPCTGGQVCGGRWWQLVG